MARGKISRQEMENTKRGLVNNSGLRRSPVSKDKYLPGWGSGGRWRQLKMVKKLKRLPVNR